MTNEFLEQLENQDNSRFAAEYFKANGYGVLAILDKRDIVQIVAKNQTTGRNETFHLSMGSLQMKVHDPKSKYHPWKYKQVARGIDTRSYLDEMRAAIDKNRQK